jgi:hypothetical protein
VVRLDLTIVLIVIGALSVVIATMYNYGRFVPVPLLSVLLSWLFPTAALVGAIGLAFRIPSVRGSELAATLFFVLLFGVFALLWAYELIVQPIRMHKDAGDVLARWRLGTATFYRRYFQFPQDTVGERVATTGVTFFGPDVMRFIVLLAVAIPGLYVVGWYNAQRLDRFVMLRRPTPCIALRRYGEGILCVDVDTAQRRLLSDFRIVPFVDTGATLHTVRLGRLRNAEDTATIVRQAPPASAPAHH